MAKEPEAKTTEVEDTANPGQLEPYPTGAPGDPYAGKKAAHPELHEEEAPPPPPPPTGDTRAADTKKGSK